MDRPRLVRIVSEGAVIVTSIMLAFWIDAWWDSRQAGAAEGTVLASIREEAEGNRSELDRVLTINRIRLARVDLFLASTPAELRLLPNDTIRPWLTALSVVETYDADLSATGLFLDSSTPVTERGLEVRAVAARWARRLEDAEEEKATLWGLQTVVTDRLASSALTVASSGQGLLDDVLAPGGADVLAQLRENEAFVQETLHRSHYQNIYLLELADASNVLDSLRAALR